MPARLGHRLPDHEGRARRDRGVDPARVQPAGTSAGEELGPVDVAWLQRSGRGVPPVGDPDGPAHPEPALREVETVAHGLTGAVEGQPRDERGVDAALQDEILEQAADLVVDERGHDRRAQPEAATQAARDVVLAPALPDPERAGGADSPLAGIEAQHDLSERHQVVGALRRGPDLEWRRRGRAHRAPSETASAARVRRVIEAKSPEAISDGATIQLPPIAAT